MLGIFPVNRCFGTKKVNCITKAPNYYTLFTWRRIVVVIRDVNMKSRKVTAKTSYRRVFYTP